MKPLTWLVGALLAAPASAWAQSPATIQPQDVQARNLMWTGHAGQDSDHLERSQPTLRALRAELAQGNDLRWTAELGRWQYRSRLDSPFASVDGGRSISENRGLFGVRYAPTLYTTLSAAVGHSSIPGDGYYAPNNYRRYAVTANMYVRLGEDAGLSVQASVGR
ncbi:MAG: hypothetical protein ACYCZD_00380 [Rhodanobacter sp.]